MPEKADIAIKPCAYLNPDARAGLLQGKSCCQATCTTALLIYNELHLPTANTGPKLHVTCCYEAESAPGPPPIIHTSYRSWLHG